jgi:Copper type II ascorbate-dependent monooxygenase, C-terminal domain
MRLYAITVLVASLAVGCGGSTGAPNGGSANDGGGGGVDAGKDGSSGDSGTSPGDDASDPFGDATAPPGSYSLQIGPIMVGAGVENTQCVVLNLNNPVPIQVGQIHNLLTNGSHHMIVYRVDDTMEQPTPFDCQPFTDTLNAADGSVLMITQKHDDLLQFPQGVAYTLPANQMIRLELHYINAGSTALEVTGQTTMIPIAAGTYQYEADFLFIGDPDISIPAHSTQTLGPVFYQLPSNFDGVNFFALTGHEHQYGTDVTVNVATSATDPGTSVYNVPGWLWSEPATVQSNPPFQVPANGGFSFTCNWDNTSDNTVSFGESANDEMCFFWAYYYPSQGGSKVCLHSDQLAGGANFCCPGSAACSIIQ